MMINYTLYRQAQMADDAFGEELRRVYGTRANEARYDYLRHSATPLLRTLAAAKHRADEAWLAEMRQAAGYN